MLGDKCKVKLLILSKHIKRIENKLLKFKMIVITFVLIILFHIAGNVRSKIFVCEYIMKRFLVKKIKYDNIE